MRIYVVTKGEYSNYRIVALFSTEERADEYVSELNQDAYAYARVEEYELDTPRDDLEGCWSIVIDQDGTLVSETWDNLGTPSDSARRLERTSVVRLSLKPTTLEHFLVNQFEGYGLTKEHARRSAEELRRQVIALEGKKQTQEAELTECIKQEDEARSARYR